MARGDIHFYGYSTAIYLWRYSYNRTAHRHCSALRHSTSHQQSRESRQLFDIPWSVFKSYNLDFGSKLFFLGKYKLTLFGSDVQDRSISEIFIHPEYNHSVYFNDIAVLKLSRPVTITNFVRPCCLWEGDSNLEGILRQEGKYFKLFVTSS